MKLEDKYNLLSEDNLIICVLILVTISVWVVFIIVKANSPDTRPEHIKNNLESQLNNVILSHINSEYYETVSRSRTVFQSSEPILFDGGYVEYWLYTFKPNSNEGWLTWFPTYPTSTVEPLIVCPHCLTILNQ